jgi:hypothetical protein
VTTSYNEILNVQKKKISIYLYKCLSIEIEMIINFLSNLFEIFFLYLQLFPEIYLEYKHQIVLVHHLNFEESPYCYYVVGK